MENTIKILTRDSDNETDSNLVSGLEVIPNDGAFAIMTWTSDLVTSDILTQFEGIQHLHIFSPKGDDMFIEVDGDRLPFDATSITLFEGCANRVFFSCHGEGYRSLPFNKSLTVSSGL